MQDRILVIGCGNAGKRHARMSRARGWDAWGMDVDPGTAQDWPGQMWMDGWPKDVEFQAAIVATPPDSHLMMAYECAQRGIVNLLIEKPLCGFGELEGAEQFARMVDESGLRVMVAYNYRYHLVTRRLKRAWESGRMRDTLVLGSYCQRDPVPAWGVVLDQMSHAVDTVVCAIGQSPTITRARVDTAGMWARVEGWVLDARGERLYLSLNESVESEDGRYAIWSYWNDSQELVERPVDPDPAMFDAMLDRFEQVIAGEAEPWPGIRDAIVTQEVLEQIRELADGSNS